MRRLLAREHRAGAAEAGHDLVGDRDARRGACRARAARAQVVADRACACRPRTAPAARRSAPRSRRRARARIASSAAAARRARSSPSVRRRLRAVASGDGTAIDVAQQRRVGVAEERDVGRRRARRASRRDSRLRARRSGACPGARGCASSGSSSSARSRPPTRRRRRRTRGRARPARARRRRSESSTTGACVKPASITCSSVPSWSRDRRVDARMRVAEQVHPPRAHRVEVAAAVEVVRARRLRRARSARAAASRAPSSACTDATPRARLRAQPVGVAARHARPAYRASAFAASRSCMPAHGRDQLARDARLAHRVAGVGHDDVLGLGPGAGSASAVTGGQTTS